MKATATSTTATARVTTARLRLACLALVGGLCLTCGAAGRADQAPPVLLQAGNAAERPLTPRQQAMLRAMQDRQARLDTAAEAALEAGDYAQAEADARQDLAAPNQDTIAPELLASALDAQGKTQEALQAYQVVANHFDSGPRALLPYALLLLKAGQWPQALAAYEKALPTLSDGDLVRSNSDFSADVTQPTELATAIHIALGLTYNWECDLMGNSQTKRALDQYGQAVRLSPDSDLANYYYGYGLQRMSRTAQAQAAFTKAIKIGHGGVKVAARKALTKLKQPT